MKEIVSAIVDKALWAENPYDRIPVTGDIQRFCIIQAKETRSRKLCFACGYFAKSHALACCRPFGAHSECIIQFKLKTAHHNIHPLFLRNLLLNRQYAP